MHDPCSASAKVPASDTGVSKRWWWPIAFGVLATPLAIALAVLSHGFGHGDGFVDDLLYPFHRPFRILLGSESAAAFIVYNGQFTVYGVVLALANRHHRLLGVATMLVAVHVAAFVLLERIASLLFSVPG